LETGIRARLSPGEGRRFGITVGLAFGALAGFFWWRGHEIPLAIAGSLGGLLVLGAALIPHRLGPVQAAWMRLAHAISLVTTPVFMAIVYFVVLTPAALLVRVFKGNPLSRQHGGGSTWVSRDSAPRSDMRRQF
jgi:Saxitoxin biosynthesis operon protein SxtJ